MNYGKHFIAEPGRKVSLKDISPHWHSKTEIPKSAQAETEKYLLKMDELQYLMYAETNARSSSSYRALMAREKME